MVVEHRSLQYSKEVWIQKKCLPLSRNWRDSDEVNFKWWKDTQEIDHERLKEET